MSSSIGLISVAAGGAVGASARYLLGQWLPTDAARLSWSILSANLVGCLLAGFLTALFALRIDLSPAIQLFLITGVLGGFTTFSAFSVNTLLIAQSGQLMLATGNVLLNLIGSLVAVVLGWSIARLF
jgi:CrcB protein